MYTTDKTLGLCPNTPRFFEKNRVKLLIKYRDKSHGILRLIINLLLNKPSKQQNNRVLLEHLGNRKVCTPKKMGRSQTVFRANRQNVRRQRSCSRSEFVNLLRSESALTMMWRLENPKKQGDEVVFA